MPRTIDPNWKPGFTTEQEAIKAGEAWTARSNGRIGRLGRDFHITTNEHGRFHFEEGRAAPKEVSPPREPFYYPGSPRDA